MDFNNQSLSGFKIIQQWLNNKPIQKRLQSSITTNKSMKLLIILRKWLKSQTQKSNFSNENMTTLLIIWKKWENKSFLKEI